MASCAGGRRWTPTFRKLTLIQQLLHTAASPSVAYLLLLIGMLLAALEFFTAGIGIAAFCGAGALVLASYGLGRAAIRPWALVLIIVGVFGFCHRRAGRGATGVDRDRDGGHRGGDRSPVRARPSVPARPRRPVCRARRCS